MRSIKTTFTMIVLIVLTAFSSLIAWWFYEDSKELTAIKKEVSEQYNLIDQVKNNQKENFQLTNDLTCLYIARTLDLQNTDAIIFPAYKIISFDLKDIMKNEFNLTANLSSDKDPVEMKSTTKLDKENSIILEYHADAGESNLLTIVKDTGYTTFFSTSQENSISTEATGYCYSN